MQAKSLFQMNLIQLPVSAEKSFSSFLFRQKTKQQTNTMIISSMFFSYDESASNFRVQQSNEAYDFFLP
jgi:hypothetical protein